MTNKRYEKDGNSTITEYTYDALPRLRTVTTAGQTTTYTYDANNNLRFS